MATAGDITVATKRRSVKQAFDGGNVPDLAEAAGVSTGSIYAWCADKRYGGKNGGLGGKYNTHPPKGNGATALPTRARTAKPRPKPLVPILFACPHCGGLIGDGS